VELAQCRGTRVILPYGFLVNVPRKRHFTSEASLFVTLENESSRNRIKRIVLSKKVSMLSLPLGTGNSNDRAQLFAETETFQIDGTQARARARARARTHLARCNDVRMQVYVIMSTGCSEEIQSPSLSLSLSLSRCNNRRASIFA